ncbi:MAG: adenylate kinase [Chloroflexi bacterium]|nr:MAG: adenylate kinase [Chloroflexota bacterium]TME38248.1 MAG: adenylate kinase [Chloroflexota bacterium]
MGDIIFMGPPGSGKGTQAQKLVRENGWVQLSTGDLFRSHIEAATELGKRVKPILDAGTYVPDDITVEMVRQRLRDIPKETRIVFDGFPRTIDQAKAIDRLLSEVGRGLDGVIYLDVPRNELIARVITRGKREGRSDDTARVIVKRLDVYEQNTRPLIDHYKQRGMLREVDGTGTVEEIATRLSEAAEATWSR